jgi:hypothetical protein
MSNQSTDHRLISDDDGHWYVISVADTERFYKFVQDCATDEGCPVKEGNYFNAKRVDGPHAITFKNWSERR